MSEDRITDYLDNTFNKKDVPLPALVPKYKKNRLSKIEVAGEEVMKKIMYYVNNTDLSYKEISNKINVKYLTNITSNNVANFLKTNKEYFVEFASQEKQLNEIRANLYLEHHKVMLKDMKEIEDQISNIKQNDIIDDVERAKVIANLLDLKGKLLIRFNKLSGKIQNNNPNNIQNNNSQINIFNNNDNDKKYSDIIQKLKKADFVEVE